MNRRIAEFLIFILVIGFPGVLWSASGLYCWLKTYNPTQTIAARIAVPAGYSRIPAAPNSFQDWLRRLPLKPENSAVYLYNAKEKANQTAHFAVVDIDVGDKDLQQCADAVMRLRAEYLYSVQAYKAIHFNFTNGTPASFDQWRAGYRPKIHGNTVTWQPTQLSDSSYASLRAYLNTVFLYAGTYSLSQELRSIPDIHDMQSGDVFIQGGFPGHAVIVVDMAVHGSTGKKLFLLAQSYMPAQDIHVLRNPTNQSLNPWYESDFGQTLDTPEWTFHKEQLKRFK